jgi:alkylation response protein AidB-like acyl-CoA dehydrogenase
MGRVLAPGPLVPTITQFAPVVREVAAPEQAAAILKEVAAGARTGTLAVAEDDGWDPAATTTTAEPDGDGDGVVLRGRKRHVLDATRVDDLAIVARTPGSTGLDGLTVALVPVGDVAVATVRALDATRVLGDIDLAGVRVPGDRVLGGPGAAGPALARGLEEAVVAQALEIVGTCQAIFDTNLEYAKHRVQFSVPIGSFQAVKHKLANMFVAIERARATAYFAAATVAEDDPRRTIASAMAKAAAGECQRVVAQDGIQLLGGIGYTWEHDQHLFVKRAKAGDSLLGSAAHHRARIADALGI